MISGGGILLTLALLARGWQRRSAALLLLGWIVATWQLSLGWTLGLQLAYLLAALAVVMLALRRRAGRAPACTCRAAGRRRSAASASR